VEPTVDTPILKPAIDEMKDFNAFILSINDLAENHGAIKIIPPQEWRNKTANFNSLNIIPIFQDVNLLNDEIYIQSHERFKSTTSVKAFWDLSDNENNRLNMDQRETMFWEEITKKRNIYAPDIEASLFDVKQKIFNMNLLNDLVSRERDENKNTINGVNTPFLYFGSFGTSFAFHVEDYNLYSMSYLHWGAPKSWYVVPPRDGKKMEKLARKYLSSYQCKDAIKHKIFLPSPRSLVANDIRFGRIRQEEGEFVVTFPYGYHGGFNNGNNIAEAINFGTRYWYENLEFGYKASKNICQCKQFDLKFGFDETTLRNLI
jgi:jumonji domain-containing protein 2